MLLHFQELSYNCFGQFQIRQRSHYTVPYDRYVVLITVIYGCIRADYSVIADIFKDPPELWMTVLEALYLKSIDREKQRPRERTYI